LVFPKQYFNEILIEIGHLDCCQIIDRTEKEPGKEKGKNYFSEFKSLNERVSKIIKKLKTLSLKDLEKIIDKEIQKNKKMIKEEGDRAFKKLMGPIMKQARGKIPGEGHGPVG